MISTISELVKICKNVDLICELMGRADIEPDIRNTARCEIKAQFLDSTRAREILGWRPQFTLEEGLKETIGWYEAYLRPGNAQRS